MPLRFGSERFEPFEPFKGLALGAEWFWRRDIGMRGVRRTDGGLLSLMGLRGGLDMWSRSIDIFRREIGDGRYEDM